MKKKDRLKTQRSERTGWAAGKSGLLRKHLESKRGKLPVVGPKKKGSGE